jgi:hypothetical protein
MRKKFWEITFIASSCERYDDEYDDGRDDEWFSFL